MAIKQWQLRDFCYFSGLQEIGINHSILGLLYPLTISNSVFSSLQYLLAAENEISRAPSAGRIHVQGPGK